MTGLWIVLAAVALALAFGGYRRLTDGKARAVSSEPTLDASRLGSELGSQATFVQFSSTVCPPCRATHRVLSELATTDPGVAHVDLDAETRLDLVDEFSVTRTPTVLLGRRRRRQAPHHRCRAARPGAGGAEPGFPPHSGLRPTDHAVTYHTQGNGDHE